MANEPKVSIWVKIFGAETAAQKMKTIEKGTNALAGSAIKAGQSFKAMFVAMLANPITLIIAGVTALGAVLAKASGEASVQEAAINDLAASMKNAGTYSQEAVQGALEYSSALQQTTEYSDEAVNSAQALLVSYSRLSGEGLNKATKATADLAAKMGMDLDQAAKLVGKTIGTNANPFKKMGLEIHGAAGSSERLQSTLTAISSIAGGAAQAKLNSFSGSVSRLKNMSGEWMEALGKGVNLALKPIVDVLTGFFTVFAKIINKLVEVTRITFVTLRVELQLIFESIKLIISAPFRISTYKTLLKTLFEYVLKVFGGIGEAIQKGMHFDFKGAKEDAKKLWDSLQTDEETYVDKTKAIIAKGEADKQEIRDESAGKIKDTLAGIVDFSEKAEVEMGADEKKLLDERIAHEEAVIDKNLQDKKNKGDKSIQAEIDANREKQRIIGLDQKERDKLELEEKALVGKQQEEQEKQLQQALVDTKTTTDNLMIIADATKSKELFEIAKAGAIAQATMDAYVAFNKSLASAPFPFSLIGAGAALATGLGTIANITSQSPKFAQGGDFVTNGAMATQNTSGQSVITGESGKELHTVTPIGKSKESSNNQPLHVSINVDGRTIAKQLYPYIQAINKRVI